ncbi:hypothetical protein, partial [Priestia megaterium]|uniref:hypothetical protein n=1 Tax=Priestia megaterium TaxID=1404 RepID=UPI002D808548
MQDEKEYWQTRLKELNKAIIDLQIERRNVRKQLLRLEKEDQKYTDKDDLKHKTTVETVYLLTSNPHKLFASRDILEHLYCQLGYKSNNFGAVYRYVKEVEPGLSTLN